MFTKEELQVMAQLINRVDIKGVEAKAVALILQRIDGLFRSFKPEPTVESSKEEEGKK